MAELEAILAESSSESDLDVGDIDLEQILREEDDDIVGALRVSSFSGDLSPTSASYNAKDWALLQQILKEDPDDDIDALLRDQEDPVEEPEEPVAEEAVNEEPVTEEPAKEASKEEPPRPTKAETTKDEPPRPAKAETTKEEPVKEEAPKPKAKAEPTKAEPPKPKAKAETTMAEPTPKPKAEPPKPKAPQAKAATGPKLWRLSRLASAQEREEKLIKKSSDHIASPLFLKRRARARETLSSVSRRAATAGRCAGKLEQMAAISRQLGKNAQYRAHGPGLPRAVSVRSKFVAVGTSRGLALVFDHFEEVRRVLGTATNEDAVTSIDVSDSLVACGHASGCMALWDVVKGAQVTKKPVELGKKAVEALRFYSSQGLVAVDSDGVVSRVSLGRSKMWTAITAEVECLLDESAEISPSSLACCKSNEDTVMVFTSKQATFVVAVDPLKIAHKWSGENIELVCAADQVRLARISNTTMEFFKEEQTCEVAPAARQMEWLTSSTVVVLYEGGLRMFDADKKELFEIVDVPGLDACCRNENLLFFLGAKELLRFRLQTPQQRVEALIDAGEWLEALALALDEYPTSATKLLRRYVSLAVENAPTPQDDKRRDLVQSHFTMLAGVCVEFCVETDQLDVLFGEIYQSCPKHLFLEAVEPYILSGKLTRLAPEVMAAFVDHFEKRGALVAVERCLLHLDVRALDFNMITALLRTHRLYTAMFRVYSEGLDDFVTPLEYCLEQSGRQALLYIRYCLAGLTFPSAEKLPEERVDSLRVELMLFLLQKDYKHIRTLAEVDAEATLDVLAVGLSLQVYSPHAADVDNPYNDKSASSVVVKRGQLPPSSATYLRAASCLYRSKAWLDFVAGHVARRIFENIDKDLAKEVLEHLIRANNDEQPCASEFDDPDARLSKVLPALPAMTAVDHVPALLELATLLGNSRAVLVVQRYEATAALESVARGDLSSLDDAARTFRLTVQRYRDCQNNDTTNQVFQFASLAFQTLLVAQDGDERLPEPLTRALVDTLPILAAVDASQSADLAASVLDDKELLDAAVAGLSDDGLKFKFVDALVERAERVANSRRDDAPLTGHVVSPEMDRLYVELLADNAPDRVFHFLSSHENAYDVEASLKLCRDRKIPDAQAFLLEQLGDGVGALKLILQTLSDRFDALRDALRAANKDGRFSLQARAGLEKYGLISRGVSEDDDDDGLVVLSGGPAYRASQAMELLPEGRAASSILDAAVRLCRRHSTSRSMSHEAWFATLDQLLGEKRALHLARELPSNAMLMHAALDDMVRRALTAMSEYVALPDIVAKLLNDHADSNLGDFRQIIVSMLQATKHETRIYTGLANLLRSEANDLRLQLAKKADAGRKVLRVDGRGKRFTIADGVAVAHGDLDPVPRKRPVFYYEDIGTNKSLAATVIPDPLVLDTRPLNKPPVDARIGTRIPGMLDLRAKFYGKLPPELAPVMTKG